MNLRFKTKELNLMLGSIAKINDVVSLQFKEKTSTIKTVVQSDDKTISLFTEFDVDVDLDDDEEVEDIQDYNINLGSVTKLLKAIKAIKDEEISFGIAENHIKYVGDKFRFKYHLIDDGLVSVPKLTTKQLEKIKWDMEFQLEADTLKSVLQLSKIFKDSSKVYIGCSDDLVKYTLTDKTVKNVDASTVLGGTYEGMPDSDFIVDVANFNRFMNPTKISIDFQLATEMGIGMLKVNDSNVKNDMIYVVASEVS